jgi:CheY-like chemotaxis protein
MPHVLLISLMAEGIDAMAVCKGIRENEDLRTIKIIALVSQLNDSESKALLQRGFDGYVSYSAEAIEVIKRIEEAIAILY